VTLRVAFFGAGGPFSSLALAEVREACDVVAVVVPARRTLIARLLFDRGKPPLSAHGAESIRFRSSAQVAKRLEAIGVDLIVVASFPRILSGALRGVARLGAINAHSSLLPRHRGPDPIFWTYFHDDRETGITIHRLDNGIDSGPILAQGRIDVARGMAGIDLYLTLARMGGAALRETVGRMTGGPVIETPQGDEEATTEPAPRDDNWSIDYNVWTAERLFHFLRGVEHRPGIAINDARGARLRTGRATGWNATGHGREAGTIEKSDGGHTRVYCIDGVVECLQ